jgi:hypothetical protein
MTDELGRDADGRPRRGFRLSVRVVIGLMFLGAAVFLWLISAESREAARRAQCVNNLKTIGLALHNYHAAEGCFPPAFLAGADGKPLVSWRVLILPYADPYLDAAPGNYRRNESWDGPNNRTLVAPTPSFYSCPSHEGARGRGLTSYVAAVGPTTAFPGLRPTMFAEFGDGSIETFLVVEMSNTTIHWTEPRDLDWNQMSFQIDDPSRPGISSEHPLGPNVLRVDGSVQRLDPSTPAATVRARLTINGGEVIRDP